MKFIKKKESNIDKTIKYIFKVNDKAFVEFSYLDNNTNKDILCVPCQTMCAMGCKFCHLTDKIGKYPLINLTSEQIRTGIDYIHKDLSLVTSTNERALLISFMGAGEPFLNIDVILDCIKGLQQDFVNIRFALATMIPTAKESVMEQLTTEVNKYNIPLKLHLSLHYTDDDTRNEWMPNALTIDKSITHLNNYKNSTGNPIEIHYTVINGVNDNNDNLTFLDENISNDTTIKFMQFSEVDTLNHTGTDQSRIIEMIESLKVTGHIVEYYDPVGRDIGSSCGQFLTDVE